MEGFMQVQDVETETRGNTARRGMNRVVCRGVVMAAMAVLTLCAFATGQERPKIAVYVTGAEEGTNKALGTMILTRLVGTGQYQAVERSDEFVKQLATEHGKQRSGAIDDEQIKKLGVQYGVDFVCIADITPALGANLISARVVNLESAEIISISNTNSPLKTLDDLSDAVVKLFGGSVGQGQQPPLPGTEAQQPQEPGDPKTAARMAYIRGKAAVEFGDYESAVRELTEAIRLDPDGSADYYFYRAQAYCYYKKDYDMAVADYTEALKIRRDYITYYSRGDAYLEKGNAAKAITDYEESLRLKPNDSDVKDKLAEANRRAGNVGGAVSPTPVSKPNDSRAERRDTGKKAIGGNSVGIGASYANDGGGGTYGVAGGDYDGKEWMATNTWSGFGAHLFLDVTYAEIGFTYLSCSGMGQDGYKGEKLWNSNNREHTFTLMGFSALGKYPVTLGSSVSLFPAVGVEYAMALSGKSVWEDEGRKSEAQWDGKNGNNKADDFSSLWFKFGAGVDITLSGSLFLRTEALYGFRLPNKAETDGVKEDPADWLEHTVVGHGLTVRIGVGAGF